MKIHTINDSEIVAGAPPWRFWAIPGTPTCKGFVNKIQISPHRPSSRNRTASKHRNN